MMTRLKLVPTPSSFVPILGAKIEARLTRDGSVTVNLKRLCASIGLNYACQLAHLQSDDCDWASIELVVAVTHDCGPQKIAMIDLESIPMWLITLDPCNVKSSVRKGLERFQEEACAVMNARFGDSILEVIGLDDSLIEP